MSNHSYRWCFTCWDFNKMTRIKTHLCDYVVVGIENCPLTQKQHYQGYIEFKKPYELGSVKRILNDKETHLEIARADASACISYCKKDNNILIEYGKHKELDWSDILHINNIK